MAAQGNAESSSEPESRCGYTIIYERTQNIGSIQNALGELFTDVTAFVQQKEFQTCIEENEDWISCLKAELCSRKEDLNNSECAVVVSGETSSGKTSIINLIIGEDILPVNVRANTTRLCRIKNSASRSISTLKAKDHILNTWTFQTNEQMAQKLDVLAGTTDSEIKYVDIFLPVQILKGNITIVDTPGIGDMGQAQFANLTLGYIPNALAFIFVVNVVNAGGLQDDRLPIIFEEIRNSMNIMYSHSPEDAIFLLNKWDALVLKHQKTDFFEETIDKLRSVWPKAKADYIIKFAAAKVDENDVFRQHYETFQNILQEVIERNVNKRMFVHTRYLQDFLTRMENTCSRSLNRGEKKEDNILKKKKKACNQITAIRIARAMLSENLDQNLKNFISAVIMQYLNHITGINFKQTIFAGIEPFTRFQIEKELKRRILIESRIWWKGNVANIFKSTVMMSFIKISEKADLHFDFSFINEKLQCLGDLIEVDNTLWTEIKSFFPGGGGVAGGLALSRVLVFPFALPGLATAGFFSGMLIKGAIKYKIFSPFQSVCEDMFKDIIENIKVEDIAHIFRNRYATQIEGFIQEFLEGSVDQKSENLKRYVQKNEAMLNTCNRNNTALISFKETFEKYKLRIKKIENVEHRIE